MSHQAYPLDWPRGWPRTESPQRSRFDTSFPVARDGVLDELNRMGVADHEIVISTNVELRRDNLPYATRAEPEDTGVAVYFHLNGKPQCIPCDRWDRVRDNLQAVRKTIDALRGLERWGADTMVRAAFSGFEALSGPADSAAPDWRTVLGVGRDATRSEVIAAGRAARSRAHPDREGGSSARFNAVQAAIDQAAQELNL